MIRAALRRAWLRLLHSVRPGHGEVELAREVRAHLGLLEDDYRRRGLSPEDARLAARRAIGGVEQLKELQRDARSVVWLDDARRDAWQALRALNRNRGFAAVAIFTLALGIGANTALFSAFNAVVLRPLPYRDPARIVVIVPSPFGLTSSATLAVWREHASQMTEFAGFIGPGATTLMDRGTPAAIDYADVTWNFLSFLGTPPAAGRDFTVADGRPGTTRVALLSHALWQRRFGGDPSVIGRTLTVDREPLLIVGVTPPTFRFPVTGLRPATGLAESLQPGVLRIASPARPMNALGRLAPQATPAMASAELLAMYRDTALTRVTKALRDRAEVAVVPLHQKLAGPLRRWLLLLMGTVAMVLLVATANVANLVLARASVRRREFAVRAALGAGMERLVRLTLTESLVLAALGAGLGLLLAWWAAAAARPLLADRMPHVNAIAIDWTVFLFNAGIATLTGLLCGLAPLATVRRLDLAAAFNDNGTPVMSGRTGPRQLLLVAEVGFSFVLVVGALLLAQTFRNLEAKDRAFDSRDVLTLRISPTMNRLEGLRDLHTAAAFVARFADDVIRQIGAVPGVASVGLVTAVPLSPTGPMFGDVAVEGVDPPRDRGVAGLFVTPGYFRTMKMPIVAGRELGNVDSAASDSVVVVNEAFQRRFSPGRPLAGSRIVADSRSWTVVGIAHDAAARTLRDEVEPIVFVPISQSDRTPFFWAQLTAVVRTAGARPAQVATAVQRAVWSLDSSAVVADVVSLDDRVAESLQAERQSAVIFTTLALIALLIAAIGIYGVATYAVAQRLKEMSIRVALGASRRDIARLITRQTMAPTVAGITAGILLAIAATRLLTTILYGVTALDPASFIAAAATLTLAALAATAFPIGRLVRLDPLSALRGD